MDRQPTRTDLYSEHLDRIKELRKKALDAKTMSREYKDIADEVKKLRSRGAYWDIAQRETVERLHKNAHVMLTLSIRYSEEADDIERNGFK